MCMLSAETLFPSAVVSHPAEMRARTHARSHTHTLSHTHTHTPVLLSTMMSAHSWFSQTGLVCLPFPKVKRPPPHPHTHAHMYAVTSLLCFDKDREGRGTSSTLN